MEENKSRRGGKRPGAGRPYKTEGCNTVVMRVPTYMKEDIELYIRMQTEWLQNKLDCYDAKEAQKRNSLLINMDCIIKHEAKRREMMFASNTTSKEAPNESKTEE